MSENGFTMKRSGMSNVINVNGCDVRYLRFFKDGEIVIRGPHEQSSPRWFDVQYLVRNDGSKILWKTTNNVIEKELFIPVPLKGENKKKIDLTVDHAFMVVVKRDHWDSDKRPYRDLYIPLDKLNYTVTKDWSNNKYNTEIMYFDLYWFNDLEVGIRGYNREEPREDRIKWLKDLEKLSELMSYSDGKLADYRKADNKDQIIEEIKRLAEVYS